MAKSYRAIHNYPGSNCSVEKRNQKPTVTKFSWLWYRNQRERPRQLRVSKLFRKHNGKARPARMVGRVEFWSISFWRAQTPFFRQYCSTRTKQSKKPMIRNGCLSTALITPSIIPSCKVQQVAQYLPPGIDRNRR